MARKLEVQIVGDASSLHKALGQADSASSKFGSTLGGVAKAGAVAAGAAGIGALFVTLKAGIGDWKESTKNAAQTEAVIKSTGGSAHVTASQVNNLAGAIQNYSGIDDDAVAAGENMLLTFTNIRNEAGKGNDIFNQSTKILADMSTALGTDMNKSAIQLGKALNDPIKGITALSRVGVTFTDDQKKLIKSLVDTGDTAGAQKVILAELNKEFGGSAKAAGDTLPGKLAILKGSFENMAGELVGAAVPALTSFVSFAADKGLPAVQKFAGELEQRMGPAVSAIGSAFKDVGPVIGDTLNSWWNVIKDNVLPIVNQLGDIFGRTVTAIAGVLRDNGPAIHSVFENLGTVISNLGKVVIPILDIAFTKVLPTAIRVLLPVLKLVTDAIALISTVAVTAITDTVKVFTEGPGKIKAAFVAAWDAVKGAFTTAFEFVKTEATTVIGDVVGFFKSLPGRIGSAITGAAGDLWSELKSLFDPGEWKKKILGFLGFASPSPWFVDIGHSIISSIAHGVGKFSGVIWDAVKDIVSKLNPFKGGPGGFDTSGVGGDLHGLLPRVTAALAYARSKGWQGEVTSGFRTYQEQARLYDRYLHGGPLAAPPGHSSHESGAAVDVTDYGTFGRIMAGAPENMRLYNHLGARDPVHYSITGYEKGGVVPGRKGAPQLAVVHGGETITPADRAGGMTINVSFPNYVGSKEELASMMRRELLRIKGRNGDLGLA